MASAADDNLSTLVYKSLDISGTNEEMKRARQSTIQSVEHFLKTLPTPEMIFTGSTSEGLIPFMRSDTDVMLVPKDVVCADTPQNNSEGFLLCPDFIDAPPGYVRVQAVRFDNNHRSKIIPHLCALSLNHLGPNGQAYISSSKFQSLCINYVNICQDLISYQNISENDHYGNGPALTAKPLIDFGVLGDLGRYRGDLDIVLAIECRGFNMLRDWKIRKRPYEWPPPSLREEVASMRGFVIPVGEKCSENTNIEWRISYVTAEKKLLSSLNNTQDKLFIILKLLAKEVLAPVCKNLSSYILKNVVLWLAELVPGSLFEPHLLLDMLIRALVFIKLCLVTNHLPNYLFPQRNLIAGRIFGEEKGRLITEINSLLMKGRSCISRVPRILQYLNYIVSKPTIFAQYGKWRNAVEKLLLDEATIQVQKIDPNMACRATGFSEIMVQFLRDERCFATQMKMLALLVPDWLEKILRGEINEIIYLSVKRANAVWYNEVPSV